VRQTPGLKTDLDFIDKMASEKEEENDHFLRSIKPLDNNALDALAHQVYDRVNAGIDCTACGNCCKSLVINVTQEEVGTLAEQLHLSQQETRDRYIEESQQGNCFINTIPCHFLADNKCTIYEHRFT
jgi:hypothetical protein